MEKENSAEYREFVVKAAHVWIAGGFLLVICVTFFFLGRWYEKSISFYGTSQYRIERETQGQNASQRAGSSEDLGESLTFFDKLPKESPSDVRSKIEQIPTSDEKATSAEKTAKQAQGDQRTQTQTAPARGSYSVQVFVSKDKASSQKIREKLSRSGYQSFMQEEKSASGPVYKVRVGRCTTTDEAQKLESKLKREGYKTWVVRID